MERLSGTSNRGRFTLVRAQVEEPTNQALSPVLDWVFCFLGRLAAFLLHLPRIFLRQKKRIKRRGLGFGFVYRFGPLKS